MPFLPAGRFRQPFTCSLRWKVETPILRNMLIQKLNVREDKILLIILNTELYVVLKMGAGEGGIDTHVLFT